MICGCKQSLELLHKAIVVLNIDYFEEFHTWDSEIWVNNIYSLTLDSTWLFEYFIHDNYKKSANAKLSIFKLFIIVLVSQRALIEWLRNDSWPAVSLLSICPRDMSIFINKKNYSRISIAALFVRAPKCKQSKCLTLNWRMNKHIMVYLYDWLSNRTTSNPHTNVDLSQKHNTE